MPRWRLAVCAVTRHAAGDQRHRLSAQFVIIGNDRWTALISWNFVVVSKARIAQAGGRLGSTADGAGAGRKRSGSVAGDGSSMAFSASILIDSAQVAVSRCALILCAKTPLTYSHAPPVEQPYLCVLPDWQVPYQPGAEPDLIAAKSTAGPGRLKLPLPHELSHKALATWGC
jgi:hypothetical protein